MRTETPEGGVVVRAEAQRHTGSYDLPFFMVGPGSGSQQPSVRCEPGKTRNNSPPQGITPKQCMISSGARVGLRTPDRNARAETKIFNRQTKLHNLD